MANAIDLSNVSPLPSTILDRRINIALLMSVTYSNPQGDPDADNTPRIDPDTGHGIITPQGIKRKVRDVWTQQGYEIHVARKAVLSRAIVSAAKAIGIDLEETEEEAPEAEGEVAAADAEAPAKKKDKKAGKKKPTSGEDKESIIKGMGRYMDFKTFGGVLTTINEAVTGPCQVSFAVSVDPIQIMELTVGRVAVASEKEAAKNKDRTLGKLAVVPFGLYRAEVTFTPYEAKRTGFTWGDFQAFMDVLPRIFDLTKSTGRSQMVLEKTIAFYHTDALGDAPSHKLMRRVKVTRNNPENLKGDDLPAPRSIDDYVVEVDREGLPSTIRVEIRD